MKTSTLVLAVAYVSKYLGLQWRLSMITINDTLCPTILPATSRCSPAVMTLGFADDGEKPLIAD